MSNIGSGFLAPLYAPCIYCVMFLCAFGVSGWCMHADCRHRSPFVGHNNNKKTEEDIHCWAAFGYVSKLDVSFVCFEASIGHQTSNDENAPLEAVFKWRLRCPPTLTSMPEWRQWRMAIVAWNSKRWRRWRRSRWNVSARGITSHCTDNNRIHSPRGVSRWTANSVRRTQERNEREHTQNTHRTHNQDMPSQRTFDDFPYPFHARLTVFVHFTSFSSSSFSSTFFFSVCPAAATHIPIRYFSWYSTTTRTQFRKWAHTRIGSVCSCAEIYFEHFDTVSVCVRHFSHTHTMWRSHPP